MNQPSLAGARRALILRRVVIAILSTLLAMTGGACSLVAPKATAVADDAGRQVELKGRPERIISMAPSNAEILFALGLGDRVVGVSNYDNYPAEAGKREKVGDALSPNFEKMVALQPDLVLAVGTAQSEIVKKLEGYKINVFILNANKVKDAMADIRLVGRITGTSGKAGQLAEAMEKRLAGVEVQVASVPADKRPTVFWVLDRMLYTVGPGSFIDDLITLAGGRNIAADAKQDYPQFNLEALIARDPDVIIVPLIDRTLLDQLKAMKGWDKLKAVKTGRVYTVDPDIVSRPGPRIVDGVQTVAKLLHPDVVK
ncbi:MAG TPA: cobalamin-binding protein [Bacillota bacterium]